MKSAEKRMELDGSNGGGFELSSGWREGRGAVVTYDRWDTEVGQVVVRRTLPAAEGLPVSRWGFKTGGGSAKAAKQQRSRTAAR